MAFGGYRRAATIQPLAIVIPSRETVEESRSRRQRFPFLKDRPTRLPRVAREAWRHGFHSIGEIPRPSSRLGMPPGVLLRPVEKKFARIRAVARLGC
jgi:hypothetical protein